MSLDIISRQTWNDVEICISDDCSTDDTTVQIENLKKTYRYPIVYSRNEVNAGYDRNYRKSIELASGEYCLVIGNDDSLYNESVLEFLEKFLRENDYPEIGFCNYVEQSDPATVIQRAHRTAVLGTGNGAALKNYSNFSFVGGVVYKREAFEKYNTDKFDGSVFAQMYLGVLMIAKNCRLFSVHEPMILKDLRIEGKMSNNYRETLAKSWKNFKVVDAGLPSVMNVLINGFKDAGTLNQNTIYRIFKKIYSITFPFWILDYKSNKAFPEAIGLISGMNPIKNKNFSLLTPFNRMRILAIYSVTSTISIVTPVSVFRTMKTRVYNFLKK
jgi:glycosyltransferase involved in cell wall biosynthesis